jgi:hypothetical protein
MNKLIQTKLGICTKYLIFFVLSASLLGCSTYSMNNAPDDVVMMPNDCANEKALSRWLTSRIELDKPLTMSEKDYQHAISYNKHALWNLRYHCGS